VNGRKRHIMVDTLGLLMHVWVSAANIQDRDGLKHMIDHLKGVFTRLKIIFADKAYTGAQNYSFLNLRCLLHIIRNLKDKKGFHVLPKRWIVERSFAWLGGYRRLNRDYEVNPKMSEAFIILANINISLKKLRL